MDATWHKQKKKFVEDCFGTAPMKLENITVMSKEHVFHNAVTGGEDTFPIE